MDIRKKIEEIRQKPEHVRMRYVWLCVSVSMMFVIAIWIFSMSSGFGTVRESVSDGSGAVSSLNGQFQENKKSLEDAYGQLKDSAENIPRDGAATSQLEQADGGSMADDASGNLDVPKSDAGSLAQEQEKSDATDIRMLPTD